MTPSQKTPHFEPIYFTKEKAQAIHFAVLKLHGEIGKPDDMGQVTLSWDVCAGAIQKAFSCKKTKAVILDINCPGGTPVETDLLTREIRRQAKYTGKPVIAFVRDHAMSGGYWLACAADEIYAMPASTVGSIGIRLKHENKHKFMEKEGLQTHFFSAGNRKIQLEPELPVKKKDVAKIKEIMRDTHNQFQDWVYERRGPRLNGSQKELMNGDFWAGHRALKRGLIDGIGDMGGILQVKCGDDKQVILHDFGTGPEYNSSAEGQSLSTSRKSAPELSGPHLRLYL